jgi:hypothetical protein
MRMNGLSLSRSLVGILAVGLLLLLSASGFGYSRYNGDPSCDDCHPGFIDRGPLHDLHVGGSQMTPTCSLCHTTTGDNPCTYQSGAAGGQGCRGCHGVDNATTFGWAAGLREHHAQAGAPADGNGLFCVDCHGGDPSPSPESVLPVYYSRPDVAVNDPCVVPSASNGEDWDGDNQGLDNDGDLIYDDSDSDCVAPVEAYTWGGIKVVYR